MATTAKIAKDEKLKALKEKGVQKAGVRLRNRCFRCGRPRAYIRKFGLCRVCLREMAHRGELPGVTKSSW